MNGLTRTKLGLGEYIHTLADKYPQIARVVIVIRRIIITGIIGLALTAIGYRFYDWLVSVQKWQTVYAFVTQFVAIVIVSFIANQLFTWSDRRGGSIRKKVSIFAIGKVVLFIYGTILFKHCENEYVELLHEAPSYAFITQANFAFILATLPVLFLGFLYNHWFVYKES